MVKRVSGRKFLIFVTQKSRPVCCAIKAPPGRFSRTVSNYVQLTARRMPTSAGFPRNTPHNYLLQIIPRVRMLEHGVCRGLHPSAGETLEVVLSNRLHLGGR